MSTANHPQTDGQTERMNRVVEDTLRAFVNHKQTDWDELLPLCQYAINTSYQASTGETAFYLNYGQHPTTPSSLLHGDLQEESLPINSKEWLEEHVLAIQLAKDV